MGEEGMLDYFLVWTLKMIEDSIDFQSIIIKLNPHR